jgi:hypothetical protein
MSDLRDELRTYVEELRDRWRVATADEFERGFGRAERQIADEIERRFLQPGTKIPVVCSDTVPEGTGWLVTPADLRKAAEPLFLVYFREKGAQAWNDGPFEFTSEAEAHHCYRAWALDGIHEAKIERKAVI